MAGQERGEIRRDAVRGLLQMLVQRRPQAGIVCQRFAKPQPGVGDALLHARVFTLHIRLQPLAQIGPHFPQIAVKRLVIFQVVLDVVGFRRHFRIVFRLSISFSVARSNA